MVSLVKTGQAPGASRFGSGNKNKFSHINKKYRIPGIFYFFNKNFAAQNIPTDTRCWRIKVLRACCGGLFV